ncbi:MAG: YdcF family protein [Gemmatimonadota bacterium]
MPLKSKPFKLFLLLLLGVSLAYVVSFFIVFLVSRQDQRRKSDAIVVLGAAQYNGKPSPVLRARLDHAILLFHDGYAPRVIVTGGIAQGDSESEATVSRRYLLSNGVPNSAVIVRPEGRSTVASIEAVGKWLKDRHLKTVVLVSDPFHMCRLRLEARRMDLEAYTSPTRTSPISAKHHEFSYFAAEALKIPIAWVRSW